MSLLCCVQPVSTLATQICVCFMDILSRVRFAAMGTGNSSVMMVFITDSSQLGPTVQSRWYKLDRLSRICRCKKEAIDSVFIGK